MVAYLRCKMIAGLLGIKIVETVFYTAFVRNTISQTEFFEERNRNKEMSGPAEFYVDLEKPTTPHFSQAEWDSGYCCLRDIGWPEHFGATKFRHVKIQLEKDEHEQIDIFVASHNIFTSQNE